jgi:hypothetical protein
MHGHFDIWGRKISLLSSISPSIYYLKIRKLHTLSSGSRWTFFYSKNASNRFRSETIFHILCFYLLFHQYRSCRTNFVARKLCCLLTNDNEKPKTYYDRFFFHFILFVGYATWIHVCLYIVSPPNNSSSSVSAFACATSSASYNTTLKCFVLRRSTFIFCMYIY